MSIQGFKVKQSEKGADFVSAVLPEDSYQCVIEKAELREGTKYMSTETEMQLLFYIRPLEVEKEFEKKLLFYQTTTSFFNGKSEKARANLKASKLYSLIKTVYKFYHPEIKVDEMKPEEITDDVINGLENKQIMAIVKINENGNNKVSDIMSIKAEVKVETSDKGKTPDEEIEEIISS